MQFVANPGYSPCPAPSLQFEIQPSSGVPIYRQLMDQVRALAASGRLATGELLPSIRQLATDLEVNMMTVSKAYARLEAEGVLERVRGTGMRISPAAGGGSTAERQRELAPLAETARGPSRPARPDFKSNLVRRSHRTPGASSVSDTTIRIRDLKKSFGSKAVLTGVDLDLPSGAVLGLMGTNGAGKTTLIKCLLNLLHPDSGTARLLGCDSRDLSPAVKERLGYVPQVVYLYPWMKVRHVLGYTASFYANWEDAWSDELVRRWRVPLDTRISAFDRSTANAGAGLGAGPQARAVDSRRAGGQFGSDRPPRVSSARS